MKIRNSADWRDAIPFDTPLRAADAVPGEAVRCTACGPDSELRERDDLWVVKHRHPTNPAGFVRFYCTSHRPVIAPRTPPAPVKAPRERRAPSRPAAPTIPARAAVFCPDCFVEVPATGVCGMCGQQVS